MSKKEDKESYLSLVEVPEETKLKTRGSAVDICR